MGALKCESLGDYFARKGINPDDFSIRPADPYDLRADKSLSRHEWAAQENARCDSLNLENTEFWEKVHSIQTRDVERFAALVAGDPDAARLKDRIKISTLVNGYVPLARQDGELVGLCPFCIDDALTFAVSDAEGLYTCSSCGATGDIFTFAKQHLDMDFHAAKAALENVLKTADGDALTDLDETGPADPEMLQTEISRLAGLDRLEYELVRRAAAKALGVRPSFLDQAVARERGDSPGKTGRQPFKIEKTLPADHAVNGKTVLNEVANLALRYLHLPAHGDTILALWSAHTYGFDAQPHSPRLAITSATKGCGKTSVLDFLSLVCQTPLRADNITGASLFRLVEQYHPTLLLDELDSYLPEADALRGILNSGYQTGGCIPRVEEIGGERQVVAFPTFSPAALAAIGRLPATLADRSISLRMDRALPGELKERLRTDRPQAFESLRREMARFIADAVSGLHEAEPKMSDIYNRTADRWRILIAIADEAGGTWPGRARAALTAEVAAERATDDDEAAIMVLEDSRKLFADLGVDKIASAHFVEKLIDLESRPWGEWRRGKPITTRGVAKLLSGFSIAPATVRLASGTAKGYRRSQFESAWKRYLAQVGGILSVTTSQPLHTGAFSDSVSVTRDENVTDEKALKPTATATCDGVTDRIPPEGACTPDQVDIRDPGAPDDGVNFDLDNIL